MQLRILGWQIKNHLLIYLLIAAIYVVFVPVLSILFCKHAVDIDYELIYGYMMFISKTLVCILGAIPFLIMLNSAVQAKCGECIVLCSEWKESKQFVLTFICYSVVLVIMMAELCAVFCPEISFYTIGRDLWHLIIPIWFVSAISHLLAKVFKNVYFSLILMELYGISCWLLHIGHSFIWNVFGLEAKYGVESILSILFYVMVGVIAEVIIVLNHYHRVENFVR